MGVNNKRDSRPTLALVLDSIFFCLSYLIPTFYSIAWLLFGWTEYVATLETQHYGGSLYGQVVAFLSVFLLLYLPFPLVLYFLKSFVYWVAGLRKNVLGSFRLDLARLFLVLPGFRKYAQATPLSQYDKRLQGRLLGWAKKHGNQIADIQVIHAKHYTRETNAFFFGVGKLSKVILLDTLFDNYTHPEIEAIIAHEFGHQHDILSTLSIVISRLFGAVLLLGWGLWHVAVLNSVESIPDIALLLIAYWFSTKLLENSISKYKEILADTYAALHIKRSSVLKSVLLKLADESFDVLTPPKFLEFLIFSHPSTAKRLENITALQQNLADMQK